MNSKLYSSLCLCLAALAAFVLPAAAEKTVEEVTVTTTTTATPGVDEGMMKKWQEYSTPGEAHAVLDPLVGNWDYTMKMWMTPDAPPEESTGTSENEWILDRRFLKQTTHGTSMGQPFEGQSIMGYNNATKEYEFVWMDSMGTGMMRGEGEYDAAAKTITDSGEFMCPMKGKMDFRGVTTLIDQDHYRYEMYMPDEKGEEFRSMEINYTRRK